MAKPDTDALVDDIEQIRARLANTVDVLIDRTSPKNVARRTMADVKGHFISEQGSPRMENIVPVVAGAAALVGLLVVIRRITR